MRWAGPARPSVGGQVARRDHGGGHPGRAEQVDLDGGVERRVEADRGGRVDDDVALRQSAQALVVEPEAVGGHVAGHGRDPAATSVSNRSP